MVRVGYRHSEETKKKISDANRGRVSPHRGIPRSEETKKRISKANSGKIRSQETKDKLSIIFKGKKLPPRRKDWCENISKVKRGAGSNFWKGGISSDTQAARNCREYNLWRFAVYKRDGYRCISCGAKKYDKKTHTRTTLHADHIKSFAMYPELRFIIGNGRTLCVDCHRKTDTWGYKSRLENPDDRNLEFNGDWSKTVSRLEEKDERAISLET